MQVKPHDNKRRNGPLAVCSNMLMEMADPLVEALRALVEREGGRHAVARKIGVNEQSLYQILRGIPLPSGKPRGVGAKLREKLNVAYPGWIDASRPKMPLPEIRDALPVVLDAIAACPHRDELRTLLALLVDHDAPAYRQRLAELLRAAEPPRLPVESRDFQPPVPQQATSR